MGDDELQRLGPLLVVEGLVDHHQVGVLHPADVEIAGHHRVGGVGIAAEPAVVGAQGGLGGVQGRGPFARYGVAGCLLYTSRCV